MFRAFLLVAGIAATLVCQAANDRNLPDLGDSTSGIISLKQEHELGQELLRSLRAQAPTISDPVLQNYVELLIYRLALNSQLQDRRLSVVLIDNDTLNAFAAPGGVVGVHDGLFLYAETEQEASAILAHELAHLSQRHFARQAEAGRKAGLPSLAGLIAGLVLIASGGGDAGMAAITAGQAVSQDRMLRYSRAWETEADRLGIETLAKAGMDPRAMAIMFERLDKATQFQTKVPEFLRTHPVTRDRITDSYNQAQQYPRHEYELDLDYQLMRARVMVNAARSVPDAISRMEAGLTETHPVKHSASQYGLVLALTEAARLDEAMKNLDDLKSRHPNKIVFTIAEANIHTRAERYEKANEILEKALGISPNNYPLTMTYAETLIKSGRAHVAEQLLVPMTTRRPNDVDLWYLLAEAYGLANNIVGVHEARAEYFVLVGNLDQAITQLGYAIPLVRGNYQKTARIRTRIEEIHELREKRRNI